MSKVFLDRLGIDVPILQAPMAGVSSPEMAAAVSNAGGLGAIAVGASTPRQAEAAIRAVRERTTRGFNVNVLLPRAGGARRHPRVGVDRAPAARARALRRRPSSVPRRDLHELRDR